jgi:hypothetical protein
MRTIIILVLGFLTGCATSYGENAWWRDGGFSETELQPGVWQVRFQGNEFTSEERAADFAFLRAAELCTQSGSNYMMVSNAQSGSQVSGVIPGNSTTTASATGVGNTVFGTANTTTTPPTVLYSPTAGLLAACVGQQIDGAWDAVFLQNSLKNKYDIVDD